MQPLGSVFRISLNDVDGFLILTVSSMPQPNSSRVNIHTPHITSMVIWSQWHVNEISSHTKLMSEHCSAIHRFIFNTYCSDKKIIKSIKIPYPYAFQPSVLYIYFRIYPPIYLHINLHIIPSLVLMQPYWCLFAKGATIGTCIRICEITGNEEDIKNGQIINDRGHMTMR